MDTRHRHMGFAHARWLWPVICTCLLTAAWLAAAPAPAAVTATPNALTEMAADPPQSLELPDFTGALVQGATLSATPGGWNGDPTSYDYQWYRCDDEACPDIAGATSLTYTLTADDVGDDVGVAVAASNDAGQSDFAASPARGPVAPGVPPSYPVLQSPPVISGIALEGQTLSASSGAWTGSPSSYSYQWYRCDVAIASCGGIAGAGAPVYSVAAADIGYRLTVRVIASNATGDSDEGSSAPTATVAGLPPANVTPPTVAGAAQEGATVVVSSAGTWSHNPTAYAYQWLRCDVAGAACAPIAGETGERHLIAAADVGSRLAALVTAANAAGPSPAAASPPTAVVLTALDITVTRVSTRVRSDGSIAMTLRTKNPGALTATATAPSRSLAAKLCVRRCPKSRQLPYGKGSARLAKPGTVTLVVKPNARAKRAVAKYRRIVVRVSVVFKSSAGNGKNTKATNVIVKKSRPKRAR
jgi:hypothetical protein